MSGQAIFTSPGTVFATCAVLLLGCNNPGATTAVTDRAVARHGARAPEGASGTAPDAPESAPPIALFAALGPHGLVSPGSGGAGSGGTGPTVLGPPFGTSSSCNDAIVGSDEECDDGPGDDVDACTATCQTRDQPVVPTAWSSGADRYLGAGRHPVSGLADGFIASYVELDQVTDEPKVNATLFDIWGKPAHVVEVSDGAAPIDDANPVAAALPGGRYAVAWGDFDGDGSDLGVALRLVEADGELGSLRAANASHEFSQVNPDMLWTGTELVVAWEDYSDAFNGPDLRYRLFDADLNPITGEATLAASSTPEAAVALAPFNGDWAAAYREGTVDGKENVVVRVGDEVFSVGPISGGPLDERPALVELDATHLLVAFSADPLAAGVTNVPRLRYAVVDTESAVAPVIRSVDPMDDVLTSEAQISQMSPAVERSVEGAYLAWRSEARPGDAAGDELWLKHLRWVGQGSAGLLHTDEPEMLIPRTCDESIGDQRVPALGRTDIHPGGGLVVAWNDFAKSQGAGAGEPDVVVHYAPTHLERPTAAPQTLAESWPGITGSAWPARWTSNMAPPVTLSTQYGEGEFLAFSQTGSAFAWVNDHTAKDADVTTTMRLGYPAFGAVIARADGNPTPNSYLAALITTRKADTWRIFSVVNGVATTHASLPLPKGFFDAGVGAGVDHRVRFRTETKSDGSLFMGMKVWRRGATEPMNWLLQTTLASTSPTALALGNVAGRFGLWAYIHTSNGGRVYFDDFSAKFFEGNISGDLDAASSAVPLLLPRELATYRNCRPGSQCEEKQGCCASNDDCAAGLACSRYQSEGLGFGSHAAVCTTALCADQIKNSGETRADCGGADCKACGCPSTVAPGAAGYCSQACACGIGEYPCSGHSHCLPGLVCGVDNGEMFGGPYGSDACVPAQCVNRVKDANETKIDCGGPCGGNCACSPANGVVTHCRPHCQCPVGQGQCSADDDCEPTLVCGAEGLRFGFATNINVCTPPHCVNNIKDATETSADCGGGCGCGGCPAGCVN